MRQNGAHSQRATHGRGGTSAAAELRGAVHAPHPEGRPRSPMEASPAQAMRALELRRLALGDGFGPLMIAPQECDILAVAARAGRAEATARSGRGARPLAGEIAAPPGSWVGGLLAASRTPGRWDKSNPFDTPVRGDATPSDLGGPSRTSAVAASWDESEPGPAAPHGRRRPARGGSRGHGESNRQRPDEQVYVSAFGYALDKAALGGPLNNPTPPGAGAPNGSPPPLGVSTSSLGATTSRWHHKGGEPTPRHIWAGPEQQSYTVDALLSRSPDGPCGDRGGSRGEQPAEPGGVGGTQHARALSLNGAGARGAHRRERAGPGSPQTGDTAATRLPEWGECGGTRRPTGAAPRLSSPLARGKETLNERVRRLFRECGLDTPLGGAQTDAYTPTASGANRALVERLDRAVAVRVHDVSDRDRLATALTWFLGFLRDTERIPFVDPDGAGGFAYNQKTLELFAEYIRVQGSRRPGHRGTQLSADTVSAYVSTVKLAAARAQRRPLVSKEDCVRLPMQMKSMRREQPPIDSPGAGSQGQAGGGRALCRALRARHLRKIAESPGFDRTSRKGVQDWGVAIMAHNLMLRGGEVGRSSKRAWDSRRGLTLESVELREPCEESDGRPWMLMRVVAIKDVAARHAPVYLAVRRHETFAVAPYLSNPLDPYDAICAAWLARRAEVPQHLRHVAPLFTSPGGGMLDAWTTDDSRRLARDLGRLVDIRESDIGGKAFRIGGATDMREAMGAASGHLIKQRGRWASDIAMVYQRALVRSHLTASVSMGSSDVASRDLEELVRGWSQSALCR